jgi:hypothetical protein
MSVDEHGSHAACAQHRKIYFPLFTQKRRRETARRRETPRGLTPLTGMTTAGTIFLEFFEITCRRKCRRMGNPALLLVCTTLVDDVRSGC